MRKALPVTIVLLALTAAAAVQVSAVYRERHGRMLEMRERIAERWAEVEALVEDRSAMIPAMVRTIKGYATREQATFSTVATARQQLVGAPSRDSKIQANDDLAVALMRLLALAEDYPELRLNADFIRVQDELAGAENRIAAERRKYNQAVQDYNTFIQLFPNNLIALLEGFERERAYFRTTERIRQSPPAGA